MNPQTVLLTVEEVMARLQLGRAKVYELLNSKRLRSLKIGTARRISEAALAEFIAASETEEGEHLETLIHRPHKFAN